MSTATAKKGQAPRSENRAGETAPEPSGGATKLPPGRMRTAEAAQLLLMSKSTVLRLGRQGHLSMFQIGRSFPTFDREQIETLARKAGTLK